MSESLAVRSRNATPVAATILFFALGFAAHAWSWAWVVFLAVPLVYLVVPGPPPARDGGVDLRKGRSTKDRA